jgi:hypothetical protein
MPKYPSMNTQTAIIEKPRLQLLAMIEGLSLDQLNQIPDGFNNNIMWNMGHIIASQQGLCYVRAGLPLSVEEPFFNTFKSGTKPERYYTAEDLDNIKALLFSTLPQLEADLQTGLFKNYTAFTTRFGFEVTGIQDAVRFLAFHEGLHIGVISAIKKLVK